MTRIAWGLLLLGCAAGPTLEPMPGGGASGAFDGRLEVAAIDALGRLVPGAEIEVDGIRVLTEDGRAAFDVEGYDAIVVRAPGHTTERWLGAHAAEVTVVLHAPEPDVGAVSGTLTVAGEPTTGVALRVVVHVAALRALDTRAAGATTRCEGAGECAFVLDVPAGDHVVMAEVLEVDAAGDVVATREVLVSELVSVVGGAAHPVALAPLAGLGEMSVTPPAAVDGVDAVVGVPGVTIGEHVLVFEARAEGVPFMVPTDAEALWVVGMGESAAGDTRSVMRLGGAVPEDVAAPALRPMDVGRRVEGALELEPGAMRVVRGGETIRIFDSRSRVEVSAEPVTVELTEVALEGGGVSLGAIEESWSQRTRAGL